MPKLVKDLPGGMRECSRCGAVKPATIDYFRRESGCISGLAGTCRDCYREAQLRYRRANAESIAARRREIYRLTKGREVKERERRRMERAPLRVRAGRMRTGMLTRARELGLPVDADVLTVEHLLQWLERQPDCPCCGVTFDPIPARPGSPNPTSASLDRIRPDRGYVVGNVAIICWRCNNLKRDATADELQTVVNWMRVMNNTQLSLLPGGTIVRSQAHDPASPSQIHPMEASERG